MKDTRILLTGSNGFLGQKLTEYIVKNTDYPLACTSASQDRNFIKKGYLFEQIDFADLPTLNNLFERFSPTNIIHTAAISSVERCENFPDLCNQVNIDTTNFIAKYCAEHGVHLTFVSTDFVFDGNNSPYNEKHLPSPVNAYGHSKWEAEQAIQHSGCRHAILRTILVYGIHGDPKRQNMVTWVRDSLAKGDSIKVVEDQWRMPTWVDDLAEACIQALEKEVNGTFHISGEEVMTIFEMAEKIADFWHLDRSLIQPVKASEIGHDKNRPKRTGFLLNRAKSELGYHPTSFDKALKEINKQYIQYRK